jgi:membrane-bound lytic murein transglycosylase A
MKSSRWTLPAIVATLAACAVAPLPEGPAAPQAPPAPSSPTAAPAIASPLARERSRWVPVAWAELPGWDADRVREWWPALLRGCERPLPPWSALCAEARVATPADDAALRRWLTQRLQPYRIEAHDGAVDGLATGYFEPLVEASRERRGRFQVPLHGLPPDLRKPYWTRQQLDTLPAAKAALRGREVAWVADPLDALSLQVQGSGRLSIGGQLVRLAYAGHNHETYRSVGRWLIDRGELKSGEASWPAIRAWARLNPSRVDELLWSNPRVVFFREEPLPDPAVGPRGAAGVPLTPGRSIAVDPLSVPYGTPIWLDTTEPLSTAPLRRLVMAQDTGSAIVGAVRADYFWGWGAEAEAQAGRMKQPLRMWALWPVEATAR